MKQENRSFKNFTLSPEKAKLVMGGYVEPPKDCPATRCPANAELKFLNQCVSANGNNWATFENKSTEEKCYEAQA